MIFGCFKKNNHGHTLDTHLPSYFFEMPKNQICSIIMQLLVIHCHGHIKSCPKQLNPQSEVNIA